MRHQELSSDDPLVSIVVPAYNAQPFIAQTLDSLVRQDLRDIEIIVVNDGSTDETKRIVDQFSFDRRIRYFEKENGGTGSALNMGHKEAKGKYMTWCSADNIYLPQFALALSQCVTMAKNQGCHFVYSDFCFMDANGRELKKVIHKAPQPPQDLVNGYDIGMSFMYTRELWEKVGDYWENICEDFNWVVRAAEYTRFALIRHVLAGFRVHGNQISGNRGEEEAAASDACKALAQEYLKGGRYDNVIKAEAECQYRPQLVELKDA